ncbi:YrdB family protein [Streptomyces sp. NPDC002540]
MAAEVVAFVVESAAPAALARRGFSTGDGVAARLLLGITPAAAVVLRGMFAAPRARFRPPLAGVLLVKAVVLGGGVCAVHAVGHPVGAVFFGVVVVVNTGLAETFRRCALPAVRRRSARPWRTAGPRGRSSDRRIR